MSHQNGTDTPGRIEDYALIGDTHTCALVGRDGSIDWLCLPRFDSPACFARLLGDDRNGRWLLAPGGEVREVRRRYRPHTLVLETQFRTATGSVRLVDCMPLAGERGAQHDVVRVVEGIDGEVDMRMELALRFDYGRTVPWVRGSEGRLLAVAGRDAVTLNCAVETRGRDLKTVAEFTVAAGDSLPFVLTWQPSHEPSPAPVDARAAVAETERWWRGWTERSSYGGGWGDVVERSLITLKALTYAPTGGVVAAATTSLPEQLGGVRNWDYRFCWLRDATLTLSALLATGHVEEAAAWRDWLLRAAAGAPRDIQIMYGAAGERWLPELELPWLRGYEDSSPVRIGNGAVDQFQLDVYGEVMDALHEARKAGIDPDPFAWQFQRALLDDLATTWREPDEGIWEVRSGRRHFTHSKVMAWVAFDRAVQGVERFGLDGPVERWREVRAEIHAEVCRHGYDERSGVFTQDYESSRLDANLLLLPLVGFVPPSDPRVVATVAAIERELCEDGLVRRYRIDDREVDGLPGDEGVFLPCSFWLADNLALQGRTDEAAALFERLLALRNDVGLLSEEYHPRRGRLLGNFPQAFTHTSLVQTARILSRGLDPA